MKAITIHQPWATALAVGMKQFETRPRKTNHRGPIAIHAGKSVNEDILEQLSGLPWSDYIQVPLNRMWGNVEAKDFPQGAILAVADLTDCLEMDEELISQQPEQELLLGHWEIGRYAYKMENVRLLDNPIPIGGKQGLWNWDEEGLDDN